MVTNAAFIGSPLTPGTYTLRLTYTNQWGETLASAPVTQIIGVNEMLRVTAPASPVLIPGATGFRVYYGLNAQPVLTQYAAGTVIPFDISLNAGLPGTPPNRSTSFYPDSDGPFASAYTMFRWLTEALTTASTLCDGIPSTSGFQTVSGTAMYLLPGTWDKLIGGWFDGWPVDFASRKAAFYRNKLPGISFLGILQEDADRTWLELQPQPNRTGGATTLSAGIGISDTSIPLTSSGSFKLDIGLALVGTEVIGYSALGPSLTGCARGLGGTTQQAWPGGTAVTELNFRFGGVRIFTEQFYPGQSGATLNVPPGWRRPLIDYILNKAREGEQSPAEAKRKLDEFSALIKQSLTSNRQVAGPRQIGGPSEYGEGIPTSGGFRIFVP